MTTLRALHVLLFGLLVACVSEPIAPAGPSPEPVRLGACEYENRFSSTPECREYLGAGWNEARARRDCERGWDGTFALSGACPTSEMLGRCVVDAGEADEYAIVFPGTDPSACESSQTGCEVFAGGVFTPSPLCSGVGPGPGPGGMGVFQQPTLTCSAPLAGEDAGAGPDGGVCTWNAISGCTEEGRRFADYASCDQVRTQRPYYPARPAEPPMIAGDDRLEDPTYQGELSWVTAQVEACACVCCHSSELAEGGPSNWFIESEPPWVDSMAPSGLALAAGWVDSTAFGAFPPEDNNGFQRTQTGIPSTDAARLRAFFEAELGRRGLTREDFVDTTPFGGPLYAQLVYEPARCDEGVGVDAEGTITWEGGAARYVYVLAQGSANPLVPPNLDLPDGTLWRLDVPSTGEPIESGIRYGVVPSGAMQRFPVMGAPDALVSGQTYYLYVSADVGVPRTRCLFTAE